MKLAGLIEVANSALPTTLDGAPLDHNCLHCQLALPIQHFMDKHPDKSREQLVRELTETLAELLASCSESWHGVESFGRQAVDYLDRVTRTKFAAHERYRRNGS